MKLDFLGVGPQRAGTTWLHDSLVAHPDVCLPKPPVKETFFFDRGYEQGAEYYQGFFDPARFERGLRVGEFGPSYFDDVRVPQRVAALSPSCKIIINVRNPVERAYSLFVHMMSYQAVPPDFDSAIAKEPRIVESGRYRTHVTRWLQAFPGSEFHFVVLDDVKADPDGVRRRVCDFIGVDPSRLPASPPEASNVGQFGNRLVRRFKAEVWHFLARHQLNGALTAARRIWRLGPRRLERGRPREEWPKLNREQEARLMELYRADVEFLEGLLGRRFDGWRHFGEP